MKYTITLPKSFTSCTIRELLESRWLVPRKVRHFLRVRKNVLLNQQTAMFHQEVHAGDEITLILQEEDYQFQAIAPGKAENVQVLYEDEHLLIVDKPAGIKTHPNQPNETATLLNDVASYLSAQDCYPHVVHRLDKETSGVILFAKNPLVLPILGRLLEQKQIYRRYQAIVHGKLLQNQTITKKIGRDRHDRRKRIIDAKGGQVAITHVEVAKVLANTTELYCVLDTGRTHQIRVHLASIQHPIVGDPLYQKIPAKRLMLHAQEMYLTHPFTQETLKITSKHALF